jgi:hypothetical protein
MFALEKGTAWWKLRRIGKGHVWGTDMILSSPQLRDEISAICITLAELRFQEYRKFSEILDEYPTEKPRVRKYAVKLTVLRGAIAYANKVREAERVFDSVPETSDLSKTSPDKNRTESGGEKGAEIRTNTISI